MRATRRRLLHELISLDRGSGHKDREATLYVKGFLARGESPTHFGEEQQRATTRQLLADRPPCVAQLTPCG